MPGLCDGGGGRGGMGGGVSRSMRHYCVHHYRQGCFMGTSGNLSQLDSVDGSAAWAYVMHKNVVMLSAIFRPDITVIVDWE